ncbi:WD domain repeat-containing protein 55 [Coemansia sp. RSA 2167]|nr:WD domain repeat-containing protein 55 [Coemansia sp. RSA 1591]KAJ1763240.1 WD domain repeat-containing protein 55 [Coemansia sp. RSA 1752]KAJ1787755.1 WD domain repeat-containing protein 55 [Coemansia sp. RSA 2167]
MDDTAARPKSLKFKEPVIDVAFSPTTNLVASSLITGHVFVHKYDVGSNQRQVRGKPHKKSCRSLCFSGDGSLLYTASKDRSWQAMDVETGAETTRIDGAHEKPLNLIKYVNEQIVATGDEAGCVKLWDVRQKKQAFSYSEHVDYVSDMVFHAPKRHLLATSGDGCLSVYDVRKAKPFQVSANQDDELLSVAVIRGGSKVVVGETDGVMGIFSYGQFGDVTDRFPGHPQSIDSICKLTEDLCVTGSSDGLLRIVQFFPHKLIGVAGDHQALPVEKVVLSYDQQWLASCSHDHTVHFWDIGYIYADEDEDDEASEAAEQKYTNESKEDHELDAQAVAIRISRDVDSDDEEDESEVDIDGCSDAGELRTSEETHPEETHPEETQTDVAQPDKPSLDAGADSEEVDIEDNSESESDNGWGSWGGSSDDEAKAAKPKKKRRKGEELADKRKARVELARPTQSHKRKTERKAFFAGL